MTAASDWAQAQVMPWAANVPLSAAGYADGLAQLNASRHEIYVFDISGEGVGVREKHVHHPLAYNRRIEHFRVGLYRDHLRAAVAKVRPSSPVSIALGVGDFVRDTPERLPVFGYQKRPGEPLLLLPDIEFLELDFYRLETPDSHPDDKQDRIVFSGSSTGRPLDEEDVAEDRGDRLRFAARFVGDPHITFTIGRAAECATPQAEAALKAKPYFRTIGWAGQQANRFILSMDGNGATCSRVVRTLRSRSALVKHRSEHALFYFAGLLPWTHFVPVEDEADLARLAPLLTRGDFPADALCDAANAFCAAHLTRERITAYTGELVARFERDVVRRLS